MAKEPMSGNISGKNRYFIMELVTMINQLEKPFCNTYKM
jgi:hypothetical protein